MPWKLAIRDALALIFATLLWRYLDSWQGETSGFAPVAGGCLGGVLLGLIWGFAAHEWGHLIGARLGRSHVHLGQSATDVQLFRFRTHENNRRQFLLMAWGGLILLWIQTLTFLVILPFSVSGLIAIGFAALGASFTTSVEAPIAVRVLRGGPLPRGASDA